MFVSCKRHAPTVRSAPEREEFSKHRNFLSKAEKVILYSTESFPSQSNEDPTTVFHGYKILGSIEIANSSLIEQIVQDMENNIDSGSGYSYTYCFDPRLGLRIFSEGVTRDFQICFECSHLYVYEDITTNNYVRIGLKDDASSELLNKTLDDNHIQR